MVPIRPRPAPPWLAGLLAVAAGCGGRSGPSRPPPGAPPAGAIPVPAGVVQLFVDDFLIDRADGLRRTLRMPRKDDGGNVPLIGPPPGDISLLAYGTIVRDPRLDRFVMFTTSFPSFRIHRHTSRDGMTWVAGDDGTPQVVAVDLKDPATGRRATNTDLFSCFYDRGDPEFPYKGWLWFSNWGNDLEGAWYMRSRDGRAWERVRQVLEGFAGEGDATCREIRQDGRVLNGPGDVTLFVPDPGTGRFLGLFKFYTTERLENGSNLRSRAYAFLDRIDEPFDVRKIDRVALLPPAAAAGGNLPHDEFYASTAWRHGSMWLGGLKVWHRGGDYPWSAAGCAFLKLVASRDGLNWAKVPFPNDDGVPEVFLPNGPEGGSGGRNDGGYISEFSQGPLRIGDEIIYYYSASSYGKNRPPDTRLSGGGIFRARLRPDGFVSVDGGVLLTKPLAFEGGDLVVNAVGPVAVEVADPGGGTAARAEVAGDSIRHRVWFGGKTLREVVPAGVARLRFSVGAGGRLYAFRIGDAPSGTQ